jgi:hypothetical protein
VSKGIELLDQVGEIAKQICKLLAHGAPFFFNKSGGRPGDQPASSRGEE